MLLEQGAEAYDTLEEATAMGYSLSERLLKLKYDLGQGDYALFQGDRDQIDLAAKIVKDPLEDSDRVVMAQHKQALIQVSALMWELYRKVQMLE